MLTGAGVDEVFVHAHFCTRRGEMEIPINAAVQCTDGPGGRSTYVVVNPITEQVTHLVVREKQTPHAERLVPVRFVKATTPEQVQLSCSRKELARLRPFVEIEFIRVQAPLLELEGFSCYGDEDLMSLPYTEMEPPHSIPEESQVLLKQRVKAIPPGELAIRRGARVEATDGRVGRVDEFVVDPESRHITHLTMRKGHLWGDEEISVPVSEIGRITEDVVYLKLDKRQIKALPAVQVWRKWR
jgi:sporulation protein YlmC with PRC-barrel domain